MDEEKKPDVAKENAIADKDDGEAFELDNKADDETASSHEEISAKDMKEVIRILIGVKNKISRSRNIKSNDLKQTYIKRLDSIIEAYSGYTVSYDLLSRYFEILDTARRFSLAFRLSENEKDFSKRLNEYFTFFEAAKIDFAEHGKWIKTIKMLFFSSMFCSALLLPPLLSIMNGKSGQMNGASLIVSLILFIVVGILVGKQLNKRTKFSMALCFCFMPICLMVSLYWINFGMKLWGTGKMGAFIQSVKASAPNGQISAANELYLKISAMGFPILAGVLLILLIMAAVKLYKNRKQFI